MSQDVSRNKLLWIAGLGWLFDAMDVGMLSFILAALQKEWGLTAEQMGWIGSMNSIGMAVGALVFGLLADRIGRKQVFIITLLLFSIGSGLSAFATTLTVFLILRFFIQGMSKTMTEHAIRINVWQYQVTVFALRKRELLFISQTVTRLIFVTQKCGSMKTSGIW